VAVIIGADVIENLFLAWSCGAAIKAELQAVKERRNAEAVTELAVHLAKKEQTLEKRVSELAERLAKKEEKLEERVRQLEGVILKLHPAADNTPLLTEEDVELAPEVSFNDASEASVEFDPRDTVKGVPADNQFAPRRVISSEQSFTNVRTTVASAAVGTAKKDEDRHRTTAIFLVLRVCCPVKMDRS
jgi:seryl-tRNA synthetase